MFHAIPQMTAPDGRPTNAVFGVTRDLISIFEDVRPTYLLCAFDTPEPTFRNELFPDYKAHRPPPSPDLMVQVPIVHAVTCAMNIPCLGIPGYEADDIMATVALAAANRGIDVVLCTTDKDCRQIIGDRVRMLNLRKKTYIDRAALLADWAVTPEQVIDFQTLVGDSVDNVPGVQGVGEKTAAKLLQQYGTLENLVAHVEEIKQPKLKENLKKAIANGDLERSRKLVRLETNVPLELTWENWERKPWDGPKLVTLFEELGFRGFANKARGSIKAAGQAKNAELLAALGATAPTPATPPTKPGRTQQDLFAGTPDDVSPDEFPFGANAEPAGDTWKTN
jgi:DNA polymerase-1